MKKLKIMTHVVVGYPSLEDTIRLVTTMEKAGVDMVELQIPFSDPLADGPTIMKACEASLARGTKVSDAFIVMKKLAKEVSIPLLFMAYYNTVFNYGSASSRAQRGDLPRQTEIATSPTAPRNDIESGVEKFCRDAKKAGCKGLIVPDVPIEEEENEHFIAMCKKYGLDNIRVVSPSSTDERLRKNAEVGTGFVYCTARQGITGVRDSLPADVTDYLKRVRKHFTIPLAVGFGISKREHIEALRDYADIAIIGSALIDVVNKGGNMEKNISEFIERIIR